MKYYFTFALIMLVSFSFCNERTFNLKSGNKVTGEIIDIDDSGNYTVSTTMGEVVFNQNEIVLESIKIITSNGDRIVGVLQNEDNYKFYVKTDIGLMSIEKNNINSIDFNFEDTPKGKRPAWGNVLPQPGVEGIYEDYFELCKKTKKKYGIS